METHGRWLAAAGGSAPGSSSRGEDAWPRDVEWWRMRGNARESRSATYADGDREMRRERILDILS
jgi:hypothetical protein